MKSKFDSMKSARLVWTDHAGEEQAMPLDEVQREIAELREQVRLLDLREDGAKTAFEHVVEQKHEIERENKKLRTLLDAAYADIRKLSAVTK